MTNKKHLERIVRKLGGQPSLDAILNLSNGDLQTLMLEVFRQRTGKITPAQLFKTYQENPFVRPSPISAHKFREIDMLLIKHLAYEFELVELSPVTPLGSCSVLATVNQNKVISGLGNAEVLADNTNTMALECALRRHKLLNKDPKDHQVINLASIHRLVRNQRPKHEKHTPHFKILGLCSAGRDTGNSEFEIKSLTAHLSYYQQLFEELLPSGQGFNWKIQITFWDNVPREKARFLMDALKLNLPGSRLELFPERTSGGSYYPHICFQIILKTPESEVQIVDGGFTPWTQKLLNSNKERLLISGMGTELLLNILGL